MIRKRSLWLLVLAGVVLACAIVAQSYGGRVKLRNDAVRGCERSQLDRRGLAALNTDVSSFAGDASVARRADGNTRTADRYLRIARRADDRTIELAARLPPRLECQQAYPYPSLLPWAG
ncbi:hypothetical protein [Patulibacter minatonensis]|uniref:hypothetical protein n=1 Tax=Patulibacter minatonensis TaxID=298163 RepID=UPI00047E702D|nr:hypothetical protein [Patulibacter minatonensis]